MKNLAIVLTVLLLSIELMFAYDIKFDGQIIKDYDRYMINQNTKECTETSDEIKNFIFEGLKTNFVEIKNIRQSSLGYETIIYIYKDKNEKVENFLFSTYSGCKFSKVLIPHKATYSNKSN